MTKTMMRIFLYFRSLVLPCFNSYEKNLILDSARLRLQADFRAICVSISFFLFQV